MAPWLRVRITVVFLAFVFVFGFITFRLVQLQIWFNPELEALAKKQFQKIGKKSPFRLPLLDRNGEELALSIPAGSVFARPRLITHKKDTARKLARLLGGSPAHWLSRLHTDKPFIWIQRQVSEDLARKIEKEKLAGVFVEAENKRIYPNESLAANLIGFTNIDGNGLSGLEWTLNEELLPRESKFQILRDGRGNPSYIDKKYISPDAKAGVKTTIDRRLQHILEEELDRSLRDTGANAVLGVVMDPFTGEIFALGQRPAFDPNHASQSASSTYSNRVTSHLYEPGSVLKVFFAAEAIERGLMSPKTPVDCGGGEYTIGNKTIREAELDHRYGMLPLEKVIAFSSNVGAIKVAQHLGTARARNVLNRFGFTSKTGIQLPAEAFSPAKPESAWSPFYLASAAFGQGVAVTPLQTMAAFATFANGGYLVRPKILLREVKSPNTDPLDYRKLLSKSTVDQMREILVGVTELKGGTGVSAKIPGLRVAGKTGTAQKYESGSGYEGGKYFSSFIGFLPADKPELLVGIMVDEPKKPYYASQTAVPVFKRVAERSLQILDRAPKRSLAQSPVSRPLPSLPAARLPELIASSDGKWIMPDLTGVNLRDTYQILGRFFQNVTSSGSGYLQSQRPKPGTPVTPQTPVILAFSPTRE